MGCGCTQNQVKAYDYVHTASNGSVKKYATEIEARAAVVRSGGSYRPVPR